MGEKKDNRVKCIYLHFLVKRWCKRAKKQFPLEKRVQVHIQMKIIAVESAVETPEKPLVLQCVQRCIIEINDI